MKKYLSILLPVAALVIGLVGGWFTAAHLYNNFIGDYMMSDTSVGIGDRYEVLQALRAGDTNKAVDALELQMNGDMRPLNGDILTFAGIRRDVPIAKLKPSEIRLITHVRDYRIAHPYVSDPEIDRNVASILSMANKTMWPDSAP
jgi:hypothetical protein